MNTDKIKIATHNFLMKIAKHPFLADSVPFDFNEVALLDLDPEAPKPRLPRPNSLIALTDYAKEDVYDTSSAYKLPEPNIKYTFQGRNSMKKDEPKLKIDENFETGESIANRLATYYEHKHPNSWIYVKPSSDNKGFYVIIDGLKPGTFLERAEARSLLTWWEKQNASDTTEAAVQEPSFHENRWMTNKSTPLTMEEAGIRGQLFDHYAQRYPSHWVTVKELPDEYKVVIQKTNARPMQVFILKSEVEKLLSTDEEQEKLWQSIATAEALTITRGEALYEDALRALNIFFGKE